MLEPPYRSDAANEGLFGGRCFVTGFRHFGLRNQETRCFLLSEPKASNYCPLTGLISLRHTKSSVIPVVAGSKLPRHHSLPQVNR